LPSTVREKCRICAEVVELIHAGSLIVDDIEDGSRTRRGQPALHIRYGMALALNAGNWLYFWPYQLLKQLRLPVDKMTFASECYHQTLLRAHFGQALDLGARVDAIPRCQTEDVCLASMRLKTGALMGFALLLGGLAAAAPKRALSVIDEFGSDLGVALQMFDDLGNVTGKCAPAKKYEDLLLNRPSWVWACAAQTANDQQYDQFVAAVKKLPDATELEAWVEKHRLMDVGRESARRHLDLAFHKLRRKLDAQSVRWSRPVFDELKALGDGIAVAYE
jgi:geranylgeranyl pyrophosphate synthase